MEATRIVRNPYPGTNKKLRIMQSDVKRVGKLVRVTLHFRHKHSLGQIVTLDSLEAIKLASRLLAAALPNET